jgi:hypothetical protein
MTGINVAFLGFSGPQDWRTRVAATPMWHQKSLYNND